MTHEELLDAHYEPVCELSEVPSIMPRKVLFQGKSLLICRDGDGVSVVDELCPHKYESMAFGVVHEGRIICPHHQYSFDLGTGACSMRKCAPVNVYPSQVCDAKVYIKRA